MDRTALARATEGTDAPTPGYLYVDLAKAASSNPTACQEMAQYLVRRLQNKQNPNIKFKCCKVIAKLAENVPRNQFRRCIAQNPSAVSAIKEAMNYRGRPDPVRGDEPNQKVRQAAKEALDAVYAEAPSSEMATPSSFSGGGAGMSASYGPSPHHSGGGGYAPSAAGGGAGGGRMQGIGNPRYSDPRLDPRYNSSGQSGVKEVMREAGEVVMGMIKDPLARNVNVPGPVPRQGHSGNLPGYGGGGGYAGRPPPGQAELSRQTGGQWTMASNRGPASVSSSQESEYYKQRDTSFQWANRTGGATSVQSGGVGGSWGSSAGQQTSHSTPSVTINTVPGASSGQGGTAASDGSYEKNLVLELCPPGGMKAVPPPDKLANFAKAAPSLNSDLVCPVLLDCLEEGQPWIIRAKALCVMETSLQSGTKADGTNSYRDFFHACQEEIVPLVGHPRAAIKEPAKRVLLLLGVAAADMPDAAAAAAPSVSAPVAPPNLLDFDDAPAPAAAAPSQPPPPPPTEAPPPPPPPTAQPPASSSSMFGGMQVKGSPTSAMNGTPTTTTAPQKTAAAPTSGNLLDFDAAPPAPPANSTDVFREAASKPVTTTSTNGGSAPSSMFADMSLKDSEDKKADSEDAGDIKSLASNGSSAFGFINESAPSKDDSAAAAARPSSESFDPLKNLTPQTAQRKMMSLSPEQMQAMAYQQMMMQQQMQQMQMAMAMQAQRGGGRPGSAAPMPPVYPNVGGAPKMAMASGQGNAATSSFSFMDARPAKKDDKKFDFVKDAMQTESRK